MTSITSDPINGSSGPLNSADPSRQQLGESPIPPWYNSLPDSSTIPTPAPSSESIMKNPIMNQVRVENFEPSCTETGLGNTFFLSTSLSSDLDTENESAKDDDDGTPSDSSIPTNSKSDEETAQKNNDFSSGSDHAPPEFSEPPDPNNLSWWESVKYTWRKSLQPPKHRYLNEATPEDFVDGG